MSEEQLERAAQVWTALRYSGDMGATVSQG